MPLGGFGVDLFGDGTPVNEIGQRHQGSNRIDSTSMIGVLTQRWSISSSPVTMTFLPANLLRLMSSLSLWRKLTVRRLSRFSSAKEVGAWMLRETTTVPSRLTTRLGASVSPVLVGAG